MKKTLAVLGLFGAVAGGVALGEAAKQDIIDAQAKKEADMKAAKKTRFYGTHRALGPR